MKIYEQANGTLREDDRLELGRLLLKGGYLVRLGKEKAPNGRNYNHYVEFLKNEDLK